MFCQIPCFGRSIAIDNLQKTGSVVVSVQCQFIVGFGLLEVGLSLSEQVEGFFIARLHDQFPVSDENTSQQDQYNQADGKGFAVIFEEKFGAAHCVADALFGRIRSILFFCHTCI